MVSFIHTADLHLGLRVTRFEADHADRIRDARIRAMENILAVAGERNVDFVLIAGDLFDDSAIDGTTARRAFHILEEKSSCPVFILPGNHDPLLPGSVWEREPWSRRDTARVRVLRDPKPVNVSERVVLFPCPVFRKTSLDDPTAWIPTVPTEERNTAIRIGIAHGSLKDRATLPPDDHLISYNAAEERQLDYLALGHWHSFRKYAGKDDVARTAYAGVHEPIGFPQATDFGTGWVPYAGGKQREEFLDAGQGSVLWGRIDRPGSTPEIEQVEVGILKWLVESHTLRSEKDVSEVIKQIAERSDPDRTIFRLRLDGVLDTTAMLRLDELREVLRGRYLHAELDVGSLRLRPSEEEVRELIGRGVLRAVFDELSQLANAGQALPEDLEEAKQGSVAERAMMLLYQIAMEARR
jgi:DNA repair exonuclease SbcCD nuclease subunit